MSRAQTFLHVTDLESSLHIVLIFANYGDYHLARARALTRLEGIETSFVELVAAVDRSPWWTGKRDFDRQVITLADSSYEGSSMRRISRKLLSVLQELEPDVVVIAGYSDPPMRTAARWARRNHRGVVLLSESTQWDHTRSWWRELIKRWWIARHVDAAVVGGAPHRAYAAKLGVDRRQIWDRYDVVDNRFFAQQADALRSEGIARRAAAGLPQNYFLYVGRFSPEKNLPLLLRAYRRYREAHSSPWGLVMVGYGPQNDELLRMAREQGVADVVWPGFKDVNELPVYYAFAGCFVLPSSLEPWGLVVNEAMAGGLPVIVSNRCGCATDLVRDGYNGFTFDPARVEQLADCMGKIADSSDDQRAAMGQGSREIISQWTPEAWAGQVAFAVRCAFRVGGGRNGGRSGSPQPRHTVRV
jgi:1,2-diacylglycerol 3-alpha-glucosyltransferase